MSSPFLSLSFLSYRPMNIQIRHLLLGWNKKTYLGLTTSLIKNKKNIIPEIEPGENKDPGVDKPVNKMTKHHVENLKD